MDWGLNEEQRAVQDAARRIARQEIDPVARAIDRSDGVVSEDLLAKLAQAGYFGLSISPEYGGSGMDILPIGLVTEELCRASLGLGSVSQRNLLCGWVLERFGTAEQKAKWLPGLASGALQSCTSGTEPEAGSDAANIKTSARRDGDQYVINGAKQYTTFADRADLVFTYVRTSTEHKHAGISLVVIEKKPGAQFAPPEFTGTHIETAGFHGMHSFSLFFDNLQVPVSNLIGAEEGQGFYQMMAGYERTRVLIGFRCLGIAQAAYDAAFGYAQQRVQFGKKIAEFQAVKFKLADMATDLAAARALCYATARAIDTGVRADVGAGMVKLFCSEMAARVTHTAMILHGGLGYAVSSDVNRYWRDGVLMSIGEGTSDIQREVISRGLMRDL